MVSVMLLLPSDKDTVTIKIEKNIQFIKYYECLGLSDTSPSYVNIKSHF